MLTESIVSLSCLKLHQNINVILATTFRRNPHDDSSTFVADVSVCKATPFYGLHSGWRYYYKISLLSPKHMTRLADLFRSGAILGRAYQPFESHVPYLLQFMIDYNLYGCSSVRCRSVLFRNPLPPPNISAIHDSSDGLSYDSVHSLHGRSSLSTSSVPVGRILHDEYARLSHSAIEVDVAAGSLLNRDALKQRAIHHDIVTEGTKLSDPNERILPSLTELWRDDARRREALGAAYSRSQAPRSNVRSRSNVWNNEADLTESLDQLLKEQATHQESRSSEQPSKHPQIEEHDEESIEVSLIPTSFESIQVFCDRQSIISFPERKTAALPPAGQIRAHKSQEAMNNIEQVKNFERQRVEFAHSQLLEMKSSKTQMLDSSEKLFQRLKTETFRNGVRSDLDMAYFPSPISDYLLRPLRLRGGSGNYEDDDPVESTFANGNYTESLVLQYHIRAPGRAELALRHMEFIKSDFPEPYYSEPSDVPALARDYAANGMIPRSRHASHLPPFFQSEQSDTPQRSSISKTYRYHERPPTQSQMANLWQSLKIANLRDRRHSTQIALPTQAFGLGANLSGNVSKRISDSDVPLSVFSLEMHAHSSGTMLPNPANNPIIAIFWAYQDFGLSGVIKEGCLMSTQELSSYDGLLKIPENKIEFFDTEVELVNAFIELVRELDPDCVLSFEMQNSSIGYLEERTKSTFGFSAEAELGRTIASSKDEPGYNDRWGETHATSVKIIGRHVLNLWRIMRSEMNLLQYTLENVCYHQLKLRIPKYNHTDLQRWLTSGQARSQQRVYKYYTQRTRLNLEIIESQGLLSRVSEQARLLGIDFYSVFSRGSQFKVESLMFRIAKPECFMMLSPSKKQVAQQNALECLPLVMEPQSRFYHDPVIVLDFQSLYPSIMIAYNFCYSTCLGKLGYRGLETKLGVTHYKPEPSTMLEVSKEIEIAPNGVLYVRDNRRKSLLAKMLHDLLETRAMVKEGMKLCKNDKAAQRLMHNRQLALKLIANVTYGYTSASFSGRMPCADIADSIVQTGRETLEKAIEFIHHHSSWNAEVVYGDTDSLFVKLPGRSKQQAFDIGNQMASAITKMSPSPIKLKFEKVYLPCILLAKKRYVGFKYENPEDVEPVFDAKGIETVRRDGTPAEQKIEEKALKILFRTGNLSAVKDYFQQECWKIMTGRCSLHDFCFAKEVKLGTYSTKGVPPPGAVISAKSIAADPRSEPQYGERVSYLIISGASRSRLTDRCVPPEELLLNPDLRLDVEYYITKNLIPPLDRLFSLMGVNVRSWYDEMPRSLKLIHKGKSTGGSKASTMIETFLSSSHCPVCHRELPKAGICESCLALPEATFYELQREAQKNEKVHRNVLRICASCCRVPMYSEIACMSKDCPIYYKRVKSGRDVDVNWAQNVLPLLDHSTI